MTDATHTREDSDGGALAETGAEMKGDDGPASFAIVDEPGASVPGLTVSPSYTPEELRELLGEAPREGVLEDSASTRAI
jgi:hypothetical protein